MDISIYLELSKALNHNILSSKPDHYGISGVANDSFKNCLVAYFNFGGLSQLVFHKALVFWVQCFFGFISTTFTYDFIMNADDTLFCKIDSISEANRHIVLNSELGNIYILCNRNKHQFIEE